MATTKRNKLNLLYNRLAPGTPVTSEDLAALGISADLAVHYVRAGWLQWLARGVYCRPNDPPALHPSLVLLQRSFEGLHVGGKSALDWHGIRHYVPHARDLQLALSEHGPTPLTVPLDDAARRCLVRFGKLMQEQKEVTTGLMRSAIGKARGLVLRLSLVLEYLRWCGEDGYAAPPDRIKEDALCAATRFVSEYALPMAERTYSDAACSETDSNTMRLAHWIKKERPDAIHIRNMQRNVRLPGLRDAKAIHAACAELIEAGWLRRPTGATAFQHRGTKAYPVSPRLKEVLGWQIGARLTTCLLPRFRALRRSRPPECQRVSKVGISKRVL